MIIFICPKNRRLSSLHYNLWILFYPSLTSHVFITLLITWSWNYYVSLLFILRYCLSCSIMASIKFRILLVLSSNNTMEVIREFQGPSSWRDCLVFLQSMVFFRAEEPKSFWWGLLPQLVCYYFWEYWIGIFLSLYRFKECFQTRMEEIHRAIYRGLFQFPKYPPKNNTRFLQELQAQYSWESHKLSFCFLLKIITEKLTQNLRFWFGIYHWEKYSLVWDLCGWIFSHAGT